MNVQHFSYNQQHFGEIDFDPTQASGRGGHLAPALHLPTSFSLFPVKMIQGPQRSILVQELTGTAVIEHAGGFKLDVIPVSLHRLIAVGPARHNAELCLPITHEQIEAIEAGRKNGVVGISLQLRLSFLVLAIQDNRFDGSQPPHLVVDAGTAPAWISFKIPQSVWTGAVLNGLGFGQVLLFELPAFPVNALTTLGEAFEAAKRAQAMFNAGEYDVAVGLCRTAVQPLRNHLKKIKEKVGNDTAADWAEKIGESTFHWLTTVLGKTHGVGSVAFHEGSTGRFSRLDAQMILTNVISILAYAARLENLHLTQR